jgi:hypothetical protein
MGQPHKWAKEIHAWADGAEIEYKKPQDTEWISAGIFPAWSYDQFEYRIKPQPTHEDIMKEHYREMAKKALAIPEISEAVDRLFEAFAEKEPQYLYAYKVNAKIVELYDELQMAWDGKMLLGKIKLETDDE